MFDVGRHPCAGMKVAKLEIKMIVAMFVMGYEYDVVDSKGRISEKLPVPDYNDIQQVRIPASLICAIADRVCFLFIG
jgi:sterol 14-demethylase